MPDEKVSEEALPSASSRAFMRNLVGRLCGPEGTESSIIAAAMELDAFAARRVEERDREWRSGLGFGDGTAALGPEACRSMLSSGIATKATADALEAAAKVADAEPCRDMTSLRIAEKIRALKPDAKGEGARTFFRRALKSRIRSALDAARKAEDEPT